MPQIFVSLTLDELIELARLAKAEDERRIAEVSSERKTGVATVAARIIREYLDKQKQRSEGGGSDEC